MTVEPVNLHLLVKPIPRDEVTKGGVVLPESVRHDDCDEGEVLATATENQRIKPGDRIVHTKHAGSQIEVDGVKLLLVPERNVLAVYRG